MGESKQVSSAVDLELEDLEGVGPTTARKMREAGIGSVVQLAVMSAEELSTEIGSTKEGATNFILAAKKLLQDTKVLDSEFTTADVQLEKRRAILRCSTGSKALDELLLGGLETHAITEFYGEFGSGKSQICHTLAVMANQAPELGGLGSKTIWLDTEGTFRPERIDQIARARGLDVAETLQNIAICKLYNSSHLELLVKELGRYIEQFKAKLVIVDSIISLHRAEFAGRGTLADRQQKLNGVMHKLTRIAEMYGVAIVITNQVQSTPDTFFGDPTKPAGGNVIGHASTYRVYLRKAGTDRVAKMIDSPYHPYSDTRFTVNERGLDDVDEKAPKKKSTSAAEKEEDE
jgi:DNA repair protein RadA